MAPSTGRRIGEQTPAGNLIAFEALDGVGEWALDAAARMQRGSAGGRMARNVAP
ncbi:MAG TPA: hypothetical protein VN812_03915 [Candidatus Acidoferrales bacterium]|nr:hypothetical protein [Candidatus Acidoferrales bacterium]